MSGAIGPEGRFLQKKSEVPKARGEKLDHTGPKSRPEEPTAGNVAEFRYECGTGDESGLALPGVQNLCRRAQGREKGREQDVGVEDEAHQDRLARSR